jgi:hypothetical protein
MSSDPSRPAPDNDVPESQPTSAAGLSAENLVQKIDIESLEVRDLIEIRTADDVVYSAHVGKKLHCILTSSNKQASALHVIIAGGTNADSSEYTPNRVFVGGRLAYAFEEGSPTIQTTPVIESLAYWPGQR